MSRVSEIQKGPGCRFFVTPKALLALTCTADLLVDDVHDILANKRNVDCLYYADTLRPARTFITAL